MLSNRLNLNPSQVSEMPEMKHEYVIIPSTSAPGWGGYFVFDVREKNCILHDAIIQFNASPLTYSTTTSSPYYTPAFFWFTRIEIVQTNNVIATIYPNEQFIAAQLWNQDEDRILLNQAAGQYNSSAQRVTLASAANSYYVDLSTYFRQGHIPLLSTATDIQIRIYMDTLSNNSIAGSSTGSPVSTINSANLIAKISRLHNTDALSLHNSIHRNNKHFKFTELRFGTFNVNSGVSNTSIVLTPITGVVQFLMFTVRNVSGLAGNNYFNYNAITNFAILDAGSTNIVGGQAIPSALALQLISKEYTKSSYTSETALGTTNNNANIYMWSFSASPSDTMIDGIYLGGYRFTGNEQLQLTFTSSLSGAVQVDVYAYVHSAVEYSASGVRKISL